MTKTKNSVFSLYLKYILKQNKLRNIILIIIGVLYLSVYLPSLLLPYASGADQDEFRYCGLDLMTVVMAVLCTIVPILEFSKFNNKRNLDTVYSMPIERRKISLAHFVSGFISIAFIYTCTFIYYFGYVLLYSSCFAVGYIPLFYVVSLVFGFILYSFFTFIFTSANTTFDGVMFCLFSIAAIFLVLFTPPFLMLLINESLSETVELYPLEFSFYGIAYFPIVCISSVFTSLIEANRYPSFTALYEPDELVMIAVGLSCWILIGALTTYGFLKQNHKKPTEKAEDVSTSPFGYKTMIPLCGYSLMIICTNQRLLTSANILCVIIYISMIIGYIIYRRGVKFKKSDLIILGIGLLMVVYGVVKFASGEQ